MFSYFVVAHSPDFIIGSESWLFQIVKFSYSVFRSNRCGKHSGGVHLACKNTSACKHIENDSEYELRSY